MSDSKKVLAQFFAKRDNGERYEGYESSQAELADAILAAFRAALTAPPTRNDPDPIQ